MIVISENKKGKQSIFVKTILDNEGQEISSRIVSMPLFEVTKDGFDYFVLYDDKMEVICEVFKFLNHDMQKSTYNTRRQAAFALRLLYCFLYLTNTKIDKIGEEQIKKLQYFLKGTGSITEKYKMITQRSNSTINGYMSVYRNFFKKRGIKSESLFDFHMITSKTNIGKDFSMDTKIKKYNNNLKVKKQKTIPKYIGINDFKKIFKFVIEKKDKQAKIILHLMYGYGLRIGEVLGLTIEDVTEVINDGNYIPVLILRNRLSDKKYQYAKNLPHVTNIKQYHSNDYIKSKQKIIITENLYEEILEYIEETHLKAMEKYSKNYNQTFADIVSYRDKLEENHYIFLNRYGRILSDQVWNKKLKKYFMEANIPIDIGVRENNLSHRFRHGFAMFHARFSEHPVDVLSLQRMMRHKKISSTMIYYNLTEEDELQIKTEFQNELYSLIPELQKGWLYK